MMNTNPPSIFEEVYSLLVEGAEHALFVTDVEGRLKMASPASCRLLEYSSEEILQLSWHQVCSIAEVFLPQECQLFSKNGNLIWVRLQSYRLKTGDTFWVAIDISERKRTEEQLRYQANLLLNVSDAIIATDINFCIASWNKAAEHLYGWTAEEAIGQSTRELLQSRYEQISPDKVLQEFLTKGSWKGEAIHNHKNGTPIYVQSAVSRLKGTNNQIIGAIAVNRDITEQKQVEIALHQSREQFAKAFRYNPAAMSILHAATGRILDVNERFCALTGYSREELVGHDVLEINVVHPDARQELIQKMMSQGGALQNVEQKLITKSGGMCDILLSLVQLDLPQGPCLLSIFYDITDWKRAEAELKAERTLLAQHVAERTAELRQTNAELAQAVKAKDEFLANMSHELRTPLSGILGSLEILLDQIYGPLNDRQVRSLHSIESSSRHLLSLISDILDLSKIEAGKLELQIERVSIADICQASLAFIQTMAARKQLQVQFKNKTEIADMQADPRRLKQILVNLLSNAVKFTLPGGYVTLEVTNDENKAVICFAVQDSGVGIAPAEMNQLFKPFTQLDSSLSRSHEGTGLGLSLVSRLTEKHGGSVKVESEGIPGKGSCFTVYLPRYHPSSNLKPDEQVPQPSIFSTTQAAFSSTKRHLVLLAEDNEVNTEAVVDYLQTKNYQIVTVQHGKDAIIQAQKLKPDLILMDIQMPVMDGLEAIHVLRNIPEFATTPIIALTALAMPGDRERCLMAGATDYMSKPVNLRGLVQKIQELLGDNL